MLTTRGPGSEPGNVIPARQVFVRVVVRDVEVFHLVNAVQKLVHVWISETGLIVLISIEISKAEILLVKHLHYFYGRPYPKFN